MFCYLDDRDRNTQEYILILPGVSVGNVGQLTADLVISTMWMSKVGYIFDEAIVPVVGNDPFAHPDSTTCKLTTAFEVFESTLHKILVIQQRAPFVKGRQMDFIDRLVSWLNEMKFRQIILLTSSFAHERIDSQLSGSQLRYLITSHVTEEIIELLNKTLKWELLEKRWTFPAPSPLEDAPREDSDGIYIPGGGIAKHFYRKCQSKCLPLAVLLVFCSEGDNIADALSLANHLNDWLDIIDRKGVRNQTDKVNSTPTEWKIPSSWRLTHGNSVDPTLFS